MGITGKCAVLYSAGIVLATAGENDWIENRGESLRWEDASLLPAASRALLVLDTPAVTRLTIAIPPERWDAEAPGDAAAKIRELLNPPPDRRGAGLKIEWLGIDPPLTGFTRFTHSRGGLVKSTSRSGNTGFTRTILASREDGVVFIHMLANHPGALSFRVSLEEPGDRVKIEDRRQLIFSPARGPASHAWVYPFESEVAKEGSSITVRGEGEALVIWNFGDKDSISGTLSRLGDRYDPGHSPPDPTRIWNGVMENHLKSAKNSP